MAAPCLSRPIGPQLPPMEDPLRTEHAHAEAERGARITDDAANKKRYEKEACDETFLLVAGSRKSARYNAEIVRHSRNNRKNRSLI